MVLVAMAGCTGASPARRGEEGVVALVRGHFYDRERAAGWAAAHAALDERSPADVARALAELHASHTAIITPDDPSFAAMAAIFGPDRERVTQPSLGADIARIGDAWFVRRVFAGGPAAAMGLLRGDEIVSADGRAFEPVRSLEGREQVTLGIRRQRGEATFFRTVPVRRESVREAWLAAQRNGTCIEEHDGKRIAIIPIFSGAGDEFLEEIEAAVSGPLRSADALVLDLRDGYGGCSPAYVRPFLGDAPLLRSRDREGRESVYDPQWRKPLVLLVNGGTRSGKEVIARSLQRHGRATIVGDRTAGAVLGGQLFALRSGAVLYLAVQDVEVDGERLEGVGVAPDVAVADPLPYAAGRDPQRTRACEIAAAAAR